MKLGTLLLRDAVINLNQLESALRTQILYGGRLGTNLVELGAVDLDTLASYLALTTGCPSAGQEQFEAADPALIADFGAELAGRHAAFPLAVDGEGSILFVALRDPRDIDTVQALADATGRAIAPHVAPELRLLYYLERHYGIARDPRFIRAGDASPPSGQPERRRMHPPGGIEIPSAVTLKPRARRDDGASAAARAAADDGGGGREPDAPATQAISAADAGRIIAAAQSRDDICETLLRYAIGRFQVMAVFIIRASNALGWRCYREAAGGAAALAHLSLPLGGASALQAAYDTREPYRGGTLSAGRPVEIRLWEALGFTGVEAPAEMLVVPVLVRQRVVNLIYVHPRAGSHISGDSERELVELASGASEAYVRLIRAAKAVAIQQAE